MNAPFTFAIYGIFVSTNENGKTKTQPVTAFFVSFAEWNYVFSFGAVVDTALCA